MSTPDVHRCIYTHVNIINFVLHRTYRHVIERITQKDLKVVRAEKDGCVLYMTGTLFAPAGVDLIAY